MATKINSPKFIAPLSRELVVGVVEMWGYGEPKWRIAELNRIGTGKVNEILRLWREGEVPKEWFK